MDGLRCPLCEAISLVNPIQDGELYDCPYCQAKFTVTSIRRFFLQPQIQNKKDADIENYDCLVKYLSYPKLVFLLRAISGELIKRHQQENNISRS